MRKYLCWLLGHSFICLFRYHNSEELQHCGKTRIEQWDA